MRIQQYIRKTAAEMEVLLKPTKLENGKWKKAKIQAREKAEIRKSAKLNGLEGSWTPGKGGWLAEWESPAKFCVMKPPKGHLNQRNIVQRVEKIQAGLADQPRMLAEHQKAVKAAKPLKGLEKWLADV